MSGRIVTLALLVILFCSALFLRVFRLSSVPAGFQMDEASKGYTAYSLLKTSRDDNGNRFPLYIDMFGDNSPAGYHYLAISTVALMGLTEAGVRMPGAVFGSLTIVAMYYLTQVIFENKKISFMSALLLTISPWHINLSRASSESLVSLFFIISGFAFIISSTKSRSGKQIFVGTLLLATSFLFYQTPRLFVPLLYLALLLFLWAGHIQKTFKKHFLLLVFSFSILILFVAFLIFAVAGGKGRFGQVSIFSSPETKLVLEEQIRGEGLVGTNVLVSRLVHNKFMGYLQAYLSNYLDYFSLSFLFVRGLPKMYQIPGMGVSYVSNLPFFLIGLYFLLSHKNRLFRLPVLWLVLGPTAAAVTTDVNNLQRALVMYPMIILIAAYGMYHSYQVLHQWKMDYLFNAALLIFAANVLYFFHQYYILSPVFQPWYRNNAFPDMLRIVMRDYNAYDKVITAKAGGYPLFQFYSKYDPQQYQKEGSPKDKDYGGFGKFIFSPVGCPFQSQNPKLEKIEKVIFIEDGSCPENDLLKKLEYSYVLRSDTTRAFRIVYINDDTYFRYRDILTPQPTIRTEQPEI